MAQSNLTRPFILALFLALATAAVYLPVTTHDFIYYDDDQYVFENPAVQQGITTESLTWAFTNIHASCWQPLTWMSHMLDCMLFQLNPAGHHLTNMLLHIANTLLLLLVLIRMTGARWQSLFVAALFALHPLNVESVAWVTERKGLLSTFFLMLTLWSYARYAKRPAIARYLLVLLFFSMGLMSKPILVTLPFLLLLLDVWPLRRFQQTRPSMALKLILEKIPLFALSALMSIIVLFAQQRTIMPLPLQFRIANSLKAYTQYIINMFWPADLAVPYLYTGETGTTHTVYLLLTAIALLAVSTLAVLSAKKYGYLFAGWFWFLGTLVPVSGLVQIGFHSHADRHSYIPLIGLFMIIAWGVVELLSKWRIKKWALPLLAGSTLIALIPMTSMQLQYWRNSNTLFNHTLDTMPDNVVALNVLGTYFYKHKKPDKAYAYFFKATQINPNYTKAHYNLGCVLAAKSRIAEAKSCFFKVLRIYPNDTKAHTKLGRILLMQEKPDEALEHLKKAFSLDPNYGETRYYLRKALDAQAAN